MPTIKFLNAAGKYSDDLALHDVISYVCQFCKTPSGIIGCSDGLPQCMAQNMVSVSSHYNKYSKVRLRHFVVSFNKRDAVNKSILASVAEAICRTIGCTYQTVYALHEDTDNLHIHFVFNAVSYITGERYRGDKASHYKLIACIRTILHSFGIAGLYEVKYRPALADPHE